MTSTVKEILVNDKNDPFLSDLISGTCDKWLSVLDKCDIVVIFDSPRSVKGVYIQFWALSYPDNILLYFDEGSSENDPKWISIGSPEILSGGVNREVEYDSRNFVTSKVMIRLSGGHVDTFYQRYRLGIKQLRITSESINTSPSLKEAVPNDDPDRTIGNTSESMHRRSLHRDPLFIFPPLNHVLKSLYQQQQSPWRILSLNSRHLERMTERGFLEEAPGKYILRRSTSPCCRSVPSRQDVLDRLRLYSG